MPTITFVRDHPADIRHRYALMSIDGAFVQRLSFGETSTHAVSAGRHTVEGKNELGAAVSLSVDVPEGSDVKIRVGAVPKGCFAAFMWVVPPAPSIELTVVKD